MANISLLSRLVAGVQRQVDLSTNTLVVGTLKVGGGAGTDLTKTILDALIALYTGLPLATNGSDGSRLVGDFNNYTNFTPTAATVKGALLGIDAALASVSSALDGTFTIDNTADPTKKLAFNVAGVATGTTRTITMPNANVDLGNLTNSNISASAGIVYSKLSLTNSIVNADIAAAAAIALTKLAAVTAHRALASDASGFIVASAVTDTELGFLSGVTSSVQTQINGKLSLTGGTMSGAINMGGNKITNMASGTTTGDALQWGQIGAANGIAGLDGGGKVPISQLPNSIMEFQGVWNASTNSPTLADGTGDIGDVYRVNVAGTQNLGSGSQTFVVGDWVIYDAGGIWRLAHAGADAVLTVNGAAGIVTVNAINQLTGDVTAGPASGSQSKAATIAAIQGTAVAGTTGSGNVVFSAAPTFTGLLSGASASFSSTITASNFSGSSSGTNTGDQTITLTGDVTGSGTGSFATTIASAAVTLSKLASNSVDENKIVSSAFSATGAITGGSGTKIAVAVDNTSIEISSNALRIKTGAYDQVTIAGGSGTPASVVAAPAVVVPQIAGEAFAATTVFAVRYGKAADGGTFAGRVYKADDDSTTLDNFWAIGLVYPAGSVSAGGAISVTEHGIINVPGHGFTVGQPVWLTSAGALSSTPPSASLTADVKIGMVKDANNIDVNVQVMGVN